MKKYLSKILLILIIVICIAGNVFSRKLNSLDEIWQYNFAKNILAGNLIYKNFNVLTTPGTHMLAALALKLIADELIVMRIITIVLGTAIILMTYKVLKKLDINKYICLVGIFLEYVFLIELIAYDYNFANLLMILIILYIELKECQERKSIFEYSRKKDFLIGILLRNMCLF